MNDKFIHISREKKEEVLFQRKNKIKVLFIARVSNANELNFIWKNNNTLKIFFRTYPGCGHDYYLIPIYVRIKFVYLLHMLIAILILIH